MISCRIAFDLPNLHSNFVSLRYVGVARYPTIFYLGYGALSPDAADTGGGGNGAAGAAKPKSNAVLDMLNGGGSGGGGGGGGWRGLGDLLKARVTPGFCVWFLSSRPDQRLPPR